MDQHVGGEQSDSRKHSTYLNVCPELWAKALEDHQDFSGVQQGGPLMFCLVMRRILDISEASILALVADMKAIKINKIVGEDIEEAVGTIKATIKVLTQCSTNVQNFVPDEIEVSALQIFQTSSLDKFNEVFRCEEMNALVRLPTTEAWRHTAVSDRSRNVPTSIQCLQAPHWP
jgi:hypothetical protein